MIYPMQVPEFEHWYHAASIAMEHFVEDKVILPGFRWRLIPIDSHVRTTFFLFAGSQLANPKFSSWTTVGPFSNQLSSVPSTTRTQSSPLSRTQSRAPFRL